MLKRNGWKAFLIMAVLGMASAHVLDSKFEQIPALDLKSAIALARKTDEAIKKTEPKTVLALKDQLKRYCDIYTEGPICLGDGARIISKAMNMHGIIGDFVFDQQITVDQSGYSNLITGNFEVRPGKLGIGSAAFFAKGRHLNMSHTKEYDTKELTVVMWVYIRKLKKKEFVCPVFLKGNDDPGQSIFSRGPGIFINQKTGTVYAYVSTADNKEGDSARTLGYLKPRKWNQLAVIFSEKAIKIYLNGVLDGYGVRSGDMLRNTDNIYIGNHPSYVKNCRMMLTIDSIKMYNRELFNYEIQAGVRTSMGIIEPSYFHLACFDCTYAEAQSKCVKSYKLCSADDLYSGVWQAAHLMGWTDLDYYIFSDNSEQAGIKGMGICCRQELY